ncbi:hypothetical protein Q3G72_002321 [Acer saccharum]|nr:hypothetical protein Q3G72_002321 [Acer saccharum]
MALAIYAWPPEGARLTRGPLWAVAPLFVAYAWGLVTGAQLGTALQPLATLVAAVMVFVALRHQPQAHRHAVRAAVFCLAAGHGLWAVLQRLGVASGPMHRASGGFFSPIDLAALAAPLALWALYAALCATRPQPRWLYGTSFGLIAAGLFCTSSRGGILGLLLGLCTALCCGMPSANKRLVRRASSVRYALYAAVGGGIALGATWAALRYRFNTAYDPDAFSRLEIWRACGRLLVAHPHGLGTGNLEHAMRLQGVPTGGAVRYLHVANNAHNTFLQTAVECGVWGALAWGTFVTSFATALCAKRDAVPRWHLGIALALLFPALVATTWQLPVMALVIAIWAAHLWPQTSGSAAVHTPPLGAATSYGIGTRRAWTAVCCLTSIMLAPAAASSLCLLEASRLVAQRQSAERVRVWTQWASYLAPWSANTALLAEHLHNLQPKPPAPLAQAEALVALAERYPQSPEPLRRAAALLQTVAHTPDQQTQLSTLWQMTAARDPHNALYWLYAARAAAQGRTPTEAPGLFAHALQQEPHCAGAWLGMAQAAQRRGDVQATKQALAQLAASVQMAPSQAGFARSILTLDAQEQISFNHLMHTLKDAP